MVRVGNGDIMKKRRNMDLNEYQKRAAVYDLGKGQGELLGKDFMAVVLGLSGEAGEVMEKFKKVIRDKEGKIDEEAREGIVSEMGDVLWYLAVVARYLGVDLEKVAQENLEKLESRKQRGKLAGSGDLR